MKNRLSEAWHNGKKINLDESLANYNFKVNFLVSGQPMQLSSLERYQSWSGVFISFIKHVRIMNRPFSLVDFLDYCLFSILLIPSFIFCISFVLLSLGLRCSFLFTFLRWTLRELSFFFFLIHIYVCICMYICIHTYMMEYYSAMRKLALVILFRLWGCCKVWYLQWSNFILFYTDVIISLFCPYFITVGNSGHTSQKLLTKGIHSSYEKGWTMLMSYLHLPPCYSKTETTSNN